MSLYINFNETFSLNIYIVQFTFYAFYGQIIACG